MGACKANVIEIIDDAALVHNTRGHCSCQYSHEATGLCDHCKVNYALKTARACIVMSVDQVSIMKARLEGTQELIIKKLRELVEGE